MTNTICFRGVPVVAVLAIGLLLPTFCLAQEVPGGQTPSPPPGGTQGGQQPTDGRQRTPTPFPGPDRTQQQQPTFPDLEQRPIYLSGNVRLADGTNPPDRVLI